MSYVFPFIARFLPDAFSRRRNRVRQYHVIRRPDENIELRQCIRPSAPPNP